MWEWSWSLRSPKDIFEGLHYPVTRFNGFCGGRGKKCAMVEKYCYNDLLMIFWGRGRRRHEKTKEWSNLIFFFQNFPTWTYITKMQHIHFFYARSFLLVHIQFAPSEGPKRFVNCCWCFFFKKSDHGSWTMGKCHLLWSDFMVHIVNWPLWPTLCIG